MSLELLQHRAVTWTLVLVLCLLMLSGAAGRAEADSTLGDFVPRQVVVELRPTTTVNKINAVYHTTTKSDSLSRSGVYLLQLPAGSDVKKTVKRMTADDKRLIFAEPNYVIQPLEGGARHRAWGVSDVAPSSQNYAASALNLSIAQNISRGEGATVAVLDTGAQLGHPALKANFEGVKRYDFVDDDNNPTDRPVGEDKDGDGRKDELVGHGTHVAGIVDFVAPAAKIMPLRVLNTDGYSNDFTIAEAVTYAKDNGANVINLSLGSPTRSKLLSKVIKHATKNDILVAAAAGNANSSKPYYPAAGNGDDTMDTEDTINGLVAVTSVNMYWRKSNFANYGSWVDIAAPGESIRSAFPISKYAYWSGTSMATPFISGEAALVHAVYGSLNPAGVEERMRCSARSLILSDPLYGTMLGAGYAGVGASLTPEGACPETTITAGPSGPTNNASANFTFSSSEGGSSFECKLDDEIYASCTSPKSYAGLAEGQHTFYVKAIDATGNTGADPAKQSFTVDVTEPNTVVDSAAEGPTNDDTPSFGWSGSDNLTAGGDLVYSWRLDNGEWSTYSGATTVAWGDVDGLTDGSYTFQVRARDQAGNVDQSPAERSFTVDTAAPDAPVISNPANDSYDNDSDITFSGTAEVGSIVELFEGSNSKGTAISDIRGDWSIILAGVADGSHTYAAKATDAAGNTSLESSARTVVVDTAAPDTTIDSAPSGTVSDGSASLTFSSSEGGSSFECKLDDEIYASCTSPKSYAGLAEGQHTFEVRATDAAGNTGSTPASRTWIVDTTTPNAPVIESPADNSLTNSGDITVSGTAEAGSTIEVFEQATSLGKSSVSQDGNWSIDLAGLADGEHPYEVRATDVAGNTSSASNVVRVTVDTAAPVINGVTPQDVATGVALADNVEAKFSEPMDPATLNQNAFTLVEQGSATPLEAIVTYDEATKEATLNPETVLQANTTYIATVNTGAKDAAGNPLATDKVWSFTTAALMS